MNNQEIFNKVVRHLHQQGGPSRSVPSIDDSSYCLYRDQDGRSCAIGCLIPDEMYSLKMEKNTCRTLLEGFSFLSSYLPDAEFGLALQVAHDRGLYGENFKWSDVWAEENFYLTSSMGVAHKLVKVAENFNLDPAVVYECWPK